MLCKVLKHGIDTRCGVVPEEVLMDVDDIISVKRLAGPESASPCVAVTRRRGADIICVGTIDTFATPWSPVPKARGVVEPKSKVSESLGRLESACRDEPSRAACDICILIDAYNAELGKPDEEPEDDKQTTSRTWRLDVEWLRATASVYRSAIQAHQRMVPSEAQAWRLEAIADRLEGKGPELDLMCAIAEKNGNRLEEIAKQMEEFWSRRTPTWHSVDEPPEDGTWCWVMTEQDEFLARYEWGDQWQLPRDGKITHEKSPVVLNGVIAWQPANVPVLPESKEPQDA